MRKLRIRQLQLCFLPVVFLIVFVRPSWGLESTTGFVVELAGYLLLLAGLGIRIWSILYIGGRKSKQIMDEGPYSLCRNPLYVGTTLLARGVGLCFENVLVLIAAVLILLPSHLLTARMEEQHLLGKFSGDYADYMARVPRFWLRFSGYTSPESVTVFARAIRRVLFDTAGVLLIPQIKKTCSNYCTSTGPFRYYGTFLDRPGD